MADNPYIHIGFNVVLLILAGICVAYSTTFLYPTKAYMLGIFGLIAISCLINLYAILRTAKNAPLDAQGSPRGKKAFISKRDIQAIGLVLAYAGGIPAIGFYTMSLVYFVTFVVLFSAKGKGEWRRATVVALVMVTIVYLLFSYFLRVPAPQGIFI